MNAQASILAAEQLLEKRVLTLEVVSPIHIGAREGKLTTLEFLFSGGRTYVIDENRLGRFLLDKGLIDVFVEAAGSGRLNLADFFKKHIKGNELAVATAVASRSIQGGADDMREFRPFVRDGNGQVFIPGTSIKGVFRTAILYATLKRNERKRKEVEQQARDHLPKPPDDRMKEAQKRYYSREWLQEKLLQDSKLPGAKKRSPNVDILRCLRVCDAYPVLDGQVPTELIKIALLSKKQDGIYYWSSGKKHGTSSGTLQIWVEAVKNGVFQTEVTWDRSLFEKFSKHNADVPVKNLAELLDMVREMTSDLCRHEEAFYGVLGQQTGTPQRDWQGRQSGNRAAAAAVARNLSVWYSKLKQNGDLMRIGFGSGMLSTTINLLFPDELRQKIRNASGHDRGNDPAPKSRRISIAPHGPCLPMGWMKMSEARWDGEEESKQPKEASVEPSEASAGNGRKKREEAAQQKETWRNATLNWHAGRQELVASGEKGRAFTKDKDIVPEKLHQKLFIKRKSVIATVEVEPEGNSFRIVKIEATE